MTKDDRISFTEVGQPIDQKRQEFSSSSTEDEDYKVLAKPKRKVLKGRVTIIEEKNSDEVINI